jgi:hypothetical protein
MRNRLPLLVAMIAGFIVLADFFVTNPLLDVWSQALIAWAMILAAATFLLGLLNVLRFHLGRIGRRGKDWGYSFVLVIALLVTLLVGLVLGPSAAPMQWMLESVYLPLQVTIFSLLAFFMAVAAYRAMQRRHGGEMVVFLLIAIIVLLGQVPLGQMLWDALPVIKGWLMEVPVTAAAHDILLGAALGIVATGLRVLLGLDRPYSDS